VQDRVIAQANTEVEIGEQAEDHHLVLRRINTSSLLRFRISWSVEDFRDVRLEAGLLDAASLPLKIEAGQAQGEYELDPGLKRLSLDFEGTTVDGEFPIAITDVLPVYIAPGTDPRLEVSIEKGIEEAPPHFRFDLDPSVVEPSLLTIEGFGPPWISGRPVSFSLQAPPSGGVSEPLSWYLDGKCAGGGTSIDLELSPGVHTLTTIASSSPSEFETALQVGRLSFQAEEAYRVTPMYLFRQFDAPSGIRGLSLSPDGRLLAGAAYSADAMLLWEVQAETGDLRLLTELRDSGGHQLDGVSATAFSPDGTVLAAVSKNSSSLQLWKIGDTTGPPEYMLQLAHRVTPDEEPSGLLDGPVDLSFSEDGRFLYVVCSTSHSLLIYRVTESELSLIQVMDQQSLGSSLFDEPTAVDLTTDGYGTAWAAVSCRTGDSVFIFHRSLEEGLLAYRQTFSNGTGGVEGLNGVQHLIMRDEHLYSSSFYDGRISHFSWREDPDHPEGGRWEYRNSYDDFYPPAEENNGIDETNPVGELRYLQDLSISSDGRVLALAAGGNDALCLFDRNILNGELEPLSAAVDGTAGLPGLEYLGDPLSGFDGARSVLWSGDDGRLYCAASNSGIINLFHRW